MNYIEIKNVPCYGSLYNADCILVSTCEDSFTIAPRSTWKATVNHVLKDEYLNQCALNGELQLEIA